jgi:uncharacterized protein YutE (UPF0331/DUF86 family)
MDQLGAHLERADRLAEITQRVGFALWQLQELEGVAATYFVLLAAAKRGMERDAGNLLVAKAKGRTFGATITQLETAGLLPGELGRRFRRVLGDRNWLVHSSRADSRPAIYDNSAFGGLLLRLDRIAEETLALLRELGSRAEKHVMAHGVTKQQIDEGAAALLDAWREADAI